MHRQVKKVIASIAGAFGYEVAKARGYEFTLAGVHYRADRCSTGRTPEGESAAAGAIRMIERNGKGGLEILDVCCGVGIIGLTVWAGLRERGDFVRSLTFADINIFNVLSTRRTVRVNHVDRALDGRVEFYLSDGLAHIPADRKFDLIIGNPPHYTDDDEDGWFTSGRLSTVDVGWEFHRAFYRDAHRHLKEGGEVWLFENREAARVEELRPHVDGNPRLAFERAVAEETAPRFYWMITRLKAGAASAVKTSAHGMV